MPIHIEIKDNHIKDLIEFYSNKQKSLKDQISRLEKDLRDVTATISQLKQRNIDPTTSAASLLTESQIFSSKWPWVKKIAFVIQEARKPLTTKEIVESLDAYEPKTGEAKKSAISSVSSTLTVKSGKYSDKRDFIKSVSETGDFAYDIWIENKNQENQNNIFGSNIVIDNLPF
jgi:hypothetical protein